SLQPGNYRFEVRAFNEDQTPSELATLAFTISPPYWQTWWFYGLETLAVLGLFYAYNRWRLKQERVKAANQRRLIKSELKALRAQMNPHFTFNTLNSIQDYISRNDSVSANDYLARFASLIRIVLENSRHNRITLEN